MKRYEPIFVDGEQIVMFMYVIYDHPKDFPDHWVLRRYLITQDLMSPMPTYTAGLYNSLAAARADVEPGSLRFPPHPGDDEIISEVWL